MHSKILLLLIANFVHGEPNWYAHKLEGWYYFQEELPEVEAPEEAEAILEEEKRQLQASLSLAILAPTKENVEAYAFESKRHLDRSSQFADAWGKALQPIDDHLTDHLSKTHFLLFCFRGQDPVSRQAAQTALAFAEKTGWKVKALSIDGQGIEGFETFETDRGLAKALDIKISPSFYAVNPEENEVLLLGTGAISIDDLERNLASHGASHE